MEVAVVAGVTIIAEAAVVTIAVISVRNSFVSINFRFLRLIFRKKNSLSQNTKIKLVIRKAFKIETSGWTEMVA